MTAITHPILQGFLDGLRPAVHLLPSDWADEHRFLSSKAANEPGRWRTKRTPYLREILNNFDSYSEVRETVIMKGAQLGLTEAGYNIMAYFIDTDPCPILSVMPTLETSQRNTKMRFDPMVEASPRLSAKIAKAKSRDTTNTMRQKDFPGGVIIFAGANSPASLRSVPIRLVVFDETDAFPTDLEGEGSPIELGMARTRTFSNKKVLKISTPTLADTSVIAAEFAKSDQRYYHVPCPHCGLMQVLRWENIIYDAAANPVTEAHYQCEGCQELIEERHKTRMLAAGEWIPTNPDALNPHRRGYHLSSFYSPLGWYSWAEAAEEYETANREENQAKAKVFHNTVRGLPWEGKTVTPKAAELYARRGGYKTKEVPAAVVSLTAGVDVQADRLEVEIVGWSEGMRSHSIDYVVLPGVTSDIKVWNDLGRLLYRHYTREGGAKIGLSKMCVDSGYNTQMVYAFCLRHSSALVVPVKGQANDKQKVILSSPKVVHTKHNGKKVGQVGLWTVGVSMLKMEIYGRLLLPLDDEGRPPPGYCFFPEDYEMQYFNMLASERLAKRVNPKGYTEFVWEKIQTRNEALDCRVYARAGAAMLGLDRWSAEHWLAARSRAYAPPDPDAAKPTRERKVKKKSSIWD